MTKQLKLGDIENIYWSVQVGLSSNTEGPIEQFRKYILTDDIISDSSDVYNSIVSVYNIVIIQIQKVLYTYKFFVNHQEIHWFEDFIIFMSISNKTILLKTFLYVLKNQFISQLQMPKLNFKISYFFMI